MAPTKKMKSNSLLPPMTRSANGNASKSTTSITGNDDIPEEYEQIIRSITLIFEQKFDKFRNDLLAQINVMD